MNIVFITNSIGFGGAEKMLVFIANSLSERGHLCIIVNLGVAPDYVNINMQAINKSVKLYNIKEEYKNRWKDIRKITYISKNNRAEVLIGFTTFPNMYATIVSKFLHIPSIISERGDPNRTIGNSVKDKIVKLIINRSRGGVFQTDGAKEFYGKGLQKRSMVIPNPIFIKGVIPQIPYSQRKKTVVSVGRLDNEQKRLDIMLKSFSIFAKAHPEYILKLYGRGTQEAEIKQWCVDLGIQNKVKFMGLTTQPMQDIACDGMFLITSDYEGISNSLLEAMAVGLPCVSTDHTPGGARLLIQDHENGLLAPIADTEAIAKAMSEFADNPALAEKCGKKAQDVVNRFEPSKIINMWEIYIDKICKHSNLK